MLVSSLRGWLALSTCPLHDQEHCWNHCRFRDSASLCFFTYMGLCRGCTLEAGPPGAEMCHELQAVAWSVRVWCLLMHCRYCGVHNPACVVKCLATGKWFCNGRSTSAGSCIIVHLVKSKNKVMVKADVVRTHSAAVLHMMCSSCAHKPAPFLSCALRLAGGAVAQGQPSWRCGVGVLCQWHAQYLCAWICAGEE